MQFSFSDRISGLQPSAIREIFKTLADPEVISLAAGSPSPDTFPAAEMAEIAAEIFAKQSDTALQYGITEGYGPLREQTAARLRGQYNTGGPDDEVLITSGGQQGLELAAKALFNEGDWVACEDPSFIGALNGLRSYGVKLIGVPTDENGMDILNFENLLGKHPNIKALYTIPTFQNPTGVTMPLARRQKLMELCARKNVVILEDDPYHELRYSGDALPSLKSMDTEGRVIYLGSYSKVISPGIRLGFACAPKALIAKMTVAKQVSDVHTNLFFQMLVSAYLDRHDLDSHILECRNLYRRKRDAMFAHTGAWRDRLTCHRPDGGLFLWCTLPEGYDGFDFCRRMTARKVAAVPGSAFSAEDGAPSRGFRLNFSLPTFEQIDRGMALVGQALDELFGRGAI